MTTQRLHGKVALITGSDSGIGQASAVAFAAEGADVVVTYLHDADGAAATAKEVEAAGRRAIVVQVDISDEAQVAAAFDRAVEAFGTVDILMNNAGVDASGTEVADLATEVGHGHPDQRLRRVLLLPSIHPGAQEARWRGQDHQRHLGP